MLSDVMTAWPPLDLELRVKLAVDIARGFEFLHTAGVYHKNISPQCILVRTTRPFSIFLHQFYSNLSFLSGHYFCCESFVQITNTFKIKITDFNLSEKLSGGNDMLKTLQSTAMSASQPMYQPPEMHILTAHETVTSRYSLRTIISKLLMQVNT